MKRKFLVTLLLIFCFMLPVGLTSCGGDDKNNNTENQSHAQYCTVTFDSDGGSEVTSKSVEKGTNVQEPTEPTKEHFKFEGWYYGDDKWSFVGYTVNQNITLKAKWTDKRFTFIGTTITGLTDYGKNLSTIEIPSSVTSIGSHAFEYCRSLTSIVIPSNVTSIGYGAFNGCSSLTNITITSSVTSISNSAFYNCSSLTDVYYDGTLSDWCKISFIDYDSNPMYYAKHFYLKNSNGEYEELTEIIIPSDVTEIKALTFDGFNNVTKVTIPNSVTSIGMVAFYGCTSLTSVVFENPYGWKINGGSYSSSGISNPETAATYLTSTYCEYTWTSY